MLYQQVQNTRKILTKLNTNEIRIKSNVSTTIITYNNFDFAKHLFEEQLDKRKVQYKIIIVLQFANVCISKAKLRQNI